MRDDATPTGWRKADQPDDEMTRYNPQPVTQYEHAETDIGIQLIPTDPQTVSASEDSYRINVLSDSTDSSGDVELLTSALDHEAALGIARKFMYAYNSRCVEGNKDLDTLMREFSETT